MATFTWDGSEDGDPTDPDNWAESGAPTLSSGGTDDLVFSGTATNPCTFSVAFYCNSITIADDCAVGRGPIINVNATLKGNTPLIIKKAGIIQSASTSVITFTGDVGANKEYVYFYAGSGGDATLNTSELGMFDSSTSRANITFKFKPGSNDSICMQDGVYPHIEIDTDSSTVYFSPTYTTLTESNTFGRVDILGFNSDAPINPLTRVENDLQKIFHINGTITLQMDVSATASVTAHRGKLAMDWGLSTVKFTPNSDAWYLPVNGDANFGPSATVGSNTFNARYHNLIIGKSSTASHRVYIRPNYILACYSLVVENGARLFGDAQYASISSCEIHTTKTPQIYGDWNFTQISEGVYRTRANSMRLPVGSGGTGNENIAPYSILYGQGHGALGTLSLGSTGEVLAVKSDGTLEWSASAGGTSLTTEEVQDIIGGMVTGNTETNIAVTYVDGGVGLGKLNFVSVDEDVTIANLKTRLAGGFGGNAVQIGDSDDTVTIGNNMIVGTGTTDNVLNVQGEVAIYDTGTAKATTTLLTLTQQANADKLESDSD